MVRDFNLTGRDEIIRRLILEKEEWILCSNRASRHFHQHLGPRLIVADLSETRTVRRLDNDWNVYL